MQSDRLTGKLTYLQYTNYGDIIYSLALFFTRLSIFLLILRIFCSVQRDRFWWLTQVLIGVNAIFYIMFFFIPIFLCSPRSKIWNPEESGHCLKIDDLYLASGIFNVLSDIAMLSVPIYLIWNLQMSFRRKLGVSAIFGTGALSVKHYTLRGKFPCADSAIGHASPAFYVWHTRSS